MRIFIAFEGSFEPFEVSADETVGAVKLMVKDCFHIPLSEDERGRQFLELTYAGAALRDGWGLADVGTSVCSTLKCFVKPTREDLGQASAYWVLQLQNSKDEEKPALYLFNAVTQDSMSIMESTALLGKKVSELRTLTSLRCGFPVSVFCLRTPRGLEMYDCNTLRDYHTDIGTTLRLDVWDGWKEFLMGCLLGHKRQVQRYLSSETPVLKFQTRVALYVAASYGHMELAEWPCRTGCGPARRWRVAWCREAQQADVSKCPIHAAAEAGQLSTLKAFVNHSALSLGGRPAAGQPALDLAPRPRHKDCVEYLLGQVWSPVSFRRVSVPMRMYMKMKQWALRAQSHDLHKRQLRGARGKGQKLETL